MTRKKERFSSSNRQSACKKDADIQAFNSSVKMLFFLCPTGLGG